MLSRRDFLASAASAVAGTLLLPSITGGRTKKITNVGIQLYTFRKELQADVRGTLQQIASLGIKQIESARSPKGNYYGLTPAEMKKACEELGMTLRSGHVQIDKDWQKTIDEAAASGQEYLICASMPGEGQTTDNYKRVAEIFNKAGEDCKKRRIKFGYHNHDYEFESADGNVLYEVLLEHTDPGLVYMELDLGWVVASGKDPLDYFNRFPGRFPLWHLKDMNLQEKNSTEFGKGGLDIPAMFRHREQSGLQYPFVEQEEYAHTPYESMKHNMDYLSKLDI